MDKVKEDISTYINYINDNLDSIINEINNKFLSSIQEIKRNMLDIINDYINPIPAHFEFFYNEYMGIYTYIENGKIDITKTIEEFLIFEHINEGGIGYSTYEDKFSRETTEMGEAIMLQSIKDNLSNYFNVVFDEDLFKNIIYECYDDIYQDCLAFDFASGVRAAEFVCISNIKLNKIQKYEG